MQRKNINNYDHFDRQFRFFHRNSPFNAIRPATTEDIPQLWELYNQIYTINIENPIGRSVMHGLERTIQGMSNLCNAYTPEQTKKWEWQSILNQKREPQRGNSIINVFEEQEMIKGYAWIKTGVNNIENEIHHIIVSPQARGAGIGTTLFWHSFLTLENYYDPDLILVYSKHPAMDHLLQDSKLFTKKNTVLTLYGWESFWYHLKKDVTFINL